MSRRCVECGARLEELAAALQCSETHPMHERKFREAFAVALSLALFLRWVVDVHTVRFMVEVGDRARHEAYEDGFIAGFKMGRDTRPE